MKERTRAEQEAIAEAAERQMRRWLLMQTIEERLEHERAAEELADRLGPYIAISREAGAGGGQIARLVGEKLGWDVLDKELLDFMADRYRLPRDILEFVDEKTANWLHETFGNWLERQVVTQSELVDHLGKIVLLAARHGKIIFVGRGAQFFLPRENGLTVRIVASEKFRIEQTMRRRALSHDAARHWIEETDRGRRELVRRYFHHDVADPDLYDLVVSAEKFRPAGVANLIVEASGAWSGTRP
jgi:cytidylate kinase